jgi:uncharacterized protein
VRQVTIQFLKNPDLTHWGFEGFWLGDDEWGDWIAVPRGSKRWKGDVDMSPTVAAAVFCAPRGEWWHLHYNGPDSYNYSHFVDIVTPPIWSTENRYEMIDLDLDVAIHIDGTLEIQDEDEFLVHQVRYGYSEEMIRRAVEETSRIAELLRAGKEPFFDVAAEWLTRVAR